MASCRLPASKSALAFSSMAAVLASRLLVLVLLAGLPVQHFYPMATGGAVALQNGKPGGKSMHGSYALLFQSLALLSFQRNQKGGKKSAECWGSRVWTFSAVRKQHCMPASYQQTRT
jgi:hypothetical protein